MENVIELTDADFEKTTASGLFCVDAWASWCMPCKMMAPLFDELANENKDKMTFAKLDVDANPKTTAALSITSIPCLFFIRNGQVVEKRVGMAQKADLQAVIDKVLAQ